MPGRYVLRRRGVSPALYVMACDGEGRRAYTRDRSRAMTFGTWSEAADEAAGHAEDPEPI